MTMAKLKAWRDQADPSTPEPPNPGNWFGRMRDRVETAVAAAPVRRPQQPEMSRRELAEAAAIAASTRTPLRAPQRVPRGTPREPTPRELAEAATTAASTRTPLMATWPTTASEDAARYEQQAATLAEQADREPAPLAMPRTRVMAQAEFDALSPSRQAAVLFNTGAIGAAQEDVTAGRLTDPTSLSSYLGGLDLDQSLGLTSVATDELLGLFDNPQARQDMASTLRWSQGDVDAAGSAKTLSDAMSSAYAAGNAMADQLVIGQTRYGSQDVTEKLGFGTTVSDSLVQYAFNNLADANQTFSLDDVSQFLAEANASEGTNISMDDVFNFADLRIRAAEYDSLSAKNGGDIMLALDPSITSKSAEQLRQELGL